MITTTLNKILAHNPCHSGWNKLTGQGFDRSKWVGNDEPLPLVDILQSNGLEDALWTLRTLEGEELKLAKLMVCDIAERVLRFVPKGEDRPANAINMARLYINGECTKEQLKKAQVDTYASDSRADAVRASVRAAVRAAADCAAAYVYSAAACAAAYAYSGDLEEKEAQKDIFIKFCNSK